MGLILRKVLIKENTKIKYCYNFFIFNIKINFHDSNEDLNSKRRPLGPE